jgi:hypothetical protein
LGDWVIAEYADARGRFCAAAERLGWRLDSHPIGAQGPLDGDLTIDVASSSTSSDRTLIVSSGIHGVEGPFGSAVQCAVMDAWAGDGPPAGVRCVFVHALNPFGFAWSRRTDAENVDPNRNFILDGEAYAGAPAAYAAFDALLNPARPPGGADFFWLRAIGAIAAHGLPALKQALVTGQYDFPKGLFFGGRGPSRTRRVVEANLAAWVGGARRVVHLDLHTGLGRWGQHKLLVDYPLAPGARSRLTRAFGADAVEEGDPSGVAAYRARGSLGPWCVSRGLAPEYVFAFVEFGTYGNLRVLAGLRAENQAHHWGRVGQVGQVGREKARLRELFAPADPRWRATALAGGVDAIRRGAAMLALPSEGRPA